MRLIYSPPSLKNTLVAFVAVASLIFANGVFAQSSGSKKADKKTEAKTVNTDTPLDLIGLWNEAKANNPQLRQLRENYLSASAALCATCAFKYSE